MDQSADQIVARLEALESALIALIRETGADEITVAVINDLRKRSEHMPRDRAMFKAFDALATNLR